MKIVVTAGHSRYDPGAVASTGEREADLMTELRDIVAKKLREAGYNVVTDGGWRQNLPLANAMTLIPGSTIAIELHTNSVKSPGPTGVESISLPDRKDVARAISQNIAKVLGLPVRGQAGWIDQSQSPRGRLGFVRLGGIVVECFFLSNPDDLKKYQERKYLVATAIVMVIISTVARTP